MKKVLSMLLCASMVISMTACGSQGETAASGTTQAVETTQTQETTAAVEKLYTAGTYTGEAKGYGGTVTVTVTVDENQILEVTVEGNDETAAIGGAALEKLAAQILEAQSADIDGVSGASFTSSAAKAAAQTALNAAMGKEAEKTALADGTYSVSSTGYSWTGMIYADVTIKDNKITDIVITEEHDSDTGEMCQTAYTYMIPRLIEAQSLDVDAISGATSTSNGIKNCVSEAITLAGGDPAQWRTPVEKKTDVVKLDGYDVIVVGLGGSGVLSYCAAAESGATVFGIETSAKLGGQSATTTGPMVVNVTNPMFEGVEFVDADELYQTWMDYLGTDEKQDIIYEAVYNSGSYMDYYIENFGFEFAGMIGSFVNPNWTQMWVAYGSADGTRNLFGTNKTYQFNGAMEKAVAYNEKNDYMLELTAEELIFDGETVVGVLAEAYDGTTYEIYGDSVILATGGFIGNDEMMIEQYGTTVNTVAATVNDGTGIQMGLSAGGTTYNMGVDPMIHMQNIPNLIKNDDLTPDQKATLSALALVRGETTVGVDGSALDLTNIGMTNMSDIPSYTYYVVYTQEQMDSYKADGLTSNFASAVSHFQGQGGTVYVETPVTDLDTVLEVGIEYKNILKASSIAELAAQIGCEEAVLSQTLGGVETTYYAVIVASYSYGTVAGLDVDANMNVLREDGTPIENLFAVGQDSMGVENVEGKPYTPWGGQANSWTYVSGYLAGHAAASYGLAK